MKASNINVDFGNILEIKIIHIIKETAIIILVLERLLLGFRPNFRQKLNRLK